MKAQEWRLRCICNNLPILKKHGNNLQWYLHGKALNLNNYLYDFKDTATNPKTQNAAGRDICLWGSPLPAKKATLSSSAVGILRNTIFPCSSAQTSFIFKERRRGGPFHCSYIRPPANALPLPFYNIPVPSVTSLSAIGLLPQMPHS